MKLGRAFAFGGIGIGFGLAIGVPIGCRRWRRLPRRRRGGDNAGIMSAPVTVAGGKPISCSRCGEAIECSEHALGAEFGDERVSIDGGLPPT
jgi:hypothetical protein